MINENDMEKKANCFETFQLKALLNSLLIDFSALSFTSALNSLAYNIPESLKKVPLLVGASR